MRDHNEQQIIAIAGRQMSIGPELGTIDQIKEIASGLGIAMTEAQAQGHLDLLNATIPSFRELEKHPERKLPVNYPRTPGWQPTADENPLNGWYWRCEIEGAAEGILKGERIAVKDTVCVAGVPMMHGSKLLEGYVPEIDATIVTRMLDAGATIVGKTNAEDLSVSAGGLTCSTGPVGNPYDPSRNPGASSSGSAVVIATGQVDMAIGGDQGGSIRLPAAWSGVYGLKPTFGLVPYSGVHGIECTLDHVGPMANSTKGVAKLLTAIAGFDPNDPRQRGVVTADHDTDYMPALERDVKGMKIAVLKEGFGHDGADGNLASDPEVEACVRAALDKLAEQGAIIEEVSIPEHDYAVHLWNAIAIEGATAFMMNGNGMGTNLFGWYNTSLAEHMARAMKARPYDLPPTVMSLLIRGEWFRKNYHNKYYGKAQNQRHIVVDAYNKVFENYDLIACPTIVAPPTEMCGRDDGPLEVVVNMLNSLRNTIACDVTGHPSMSIPCGMRHGLPVGLMLSGKHFDEQTILAASNTFERLGDWKKM